MTFLLHPKINGGANTTRLIMVVIISLVLLQGQSPEGRLFANLRGPLYI